MWAKSMSLRLALTTRKAGRRQVGDHQVVEDAAGLVGQQRVALPAGLERRDVAGHQPLQRRGRAVALQRRLAHVGDVEQRGVGAAVQVLGHDAGGVLHRHGVAGEGHHARAQLAVQRVERGGRQRLVGRRAGSLGHGRSAQGRAAGVQCRRA